MVNANAAFIGAIPENYDAYLGPLFFHQFADDIVERVSVFPGVSILETACGTGIVTERLLARLGGNGRLVATDLNEAMFLHARRRGVAGAGLEWRQADAMALPFEAAAFDAVVCQFGLMFLPDKQQGLREALRVLKPGGQLLFNVWDALAANPIARIAHETIVAFFPENPPQFYSVPFSLHDPAPIRGWLEGVGFAKVECHTLAKTGTSPAAVDAAHGLVEGNPVYAEIMNRRPEALGEIKQAVARRIAAELGDHPVTCPLRAHVFVARRP